MQCFPNLVGCEIPDVFIVSEARVLQGAVWELLKSAVSANP